MQQRIRVNLTSGEGFFILFDVPNVEQFQKEHPAINLGDGTFLCFYVINVSGTGKTICLNQATIKPLPAATKTV